MAERLYAQLSFEQAVRKYASCVRGVCVMRLQNAADADDCFQNTFLKLYTKSPEFKNEEHLKAWLLRVAINECKQFLRRNRRHLPLEYAADIPLPSAEDESDISWAIMRLEPKYREILYLYYGEGYETAEIAQILGMNHNTVRTNLKRGRDKLKKLYGGDEE